MPSINLTTGVDSSGVATGMAAIRNMVAQTGSQIASLLAGPALLAGLTAATKSVVEYGARIFDLGQRFKTGTTELQQFGNAAERHGASLDSLALGFNRLDVALEKARKGDIEMQHALEALNITNWRDKSLTLAQAMLEIGSSSMGAADMVKVLGKNGTELRDTLTALATGADHLAEAMDPKTIQALKNADTEMKKLGETSRVTTGNVLGFIDVLFAKPAAAADTTSRAFTALGDAIDHVFRGDFTGAIGILEKTGNEFDQENRKASQLRQTVEALATALHLVIPPNVPTKESVQPTLITGDMTELTDRLEISKKEEQNRLAALGDEQRLTNLTAQRSKLQAEFEVAQRGGTSTTERQLDLENQIADLDGKIIPLEKQITDAKAQQADADFKATSAIEEKIQKSKDRLTIENLIAAGRSDEAEGLRIVLDYEDKIRAALNDANEARQKGDTIVADENTKLAQQLALEQQDALAAAQQEENQKVAQKGMAPLSPLTGFGPFYGSGGGYVPSSTALGLATSPITGAVDQVALARYTAEAALGAITGKEVFSFIDRAIADRNLLSSADAAFQAQQAQYATQQQATIAYLQGIINGRPIPYPSSPGTTFGPYSIAAPSPFTYGAAVPGSLAAISGSTTNFETSATVAQLSQQIAIMQQQLATQQQMLVMLTPQPG